MNFQHFYKRAIMLTGIYLIITFYLICLLFYCVFKEKNKSMQITAIIALIPFILRLLMIK